MAVFSLSRPSSHRTVPERSGVVCRVKYCNSLPDIPFDPKFITYPFDQHRFVQYKATSLEKQHKHELLTEPDLGVTIDLINPDTYRIDPNILLDPADEKLLEEDIQAPSSSKRSQQHAKVFNRYGVSNEKVEVKIGVSVKQQFTEEEIYKDRDSQISAIEKTFEDAQKSISQHYSKPRVTPVEILPVFPDFKMWINPCAQVIFDSDPAPKDISGPAGVEMMSQAMIRGMMDEEGNQFVAYFLPNEDTLRKRKRDCEEGVDYMPDDLYDYKIAREYNWNVKNKASKGYEENYFFIFRDGDGVYYNELETRVRLSKRRAKAGAQSTTNAVLVCKHRDMNEKELEAQEARKAQLENHEPEDEEEDMDMDKDMQDSGDEKDKGSGSEVENSGSESEREDEDREQRGEDDEEDEDRGKRRRKASGSGSESGEERTREMRDEEEIFGSDDDSDDNEPKNRSSGDEGSGSEDEGRNRGGSRSRSASPAHSDRSSDHSEAQAQSGSGSDRGSDSSDASDSE
uniref:RNA polymerase II-associated factor 1 homolog n=1 Tax=Lates calcarifer TaxID=8187 RepID=A0A4W6G3J6_LATCA